MITQIFKERLHRFFLRKHNLCLDFNLYNHRNRLFQNSLLLFVVTILFLKILTSLAEEQTVIEYTSFNERDPFESLLKEKEESRMLPGQEEIREEKATGKIALPQLSLQGIIWDAPIPQAIIDDRIVKIGDRVKEAEVLDINKEGVTLLFQNKKFMIKPK